MRIGGIAKNLYVPESSDEVIALITDFLNTEKHYYLISGGSNILINDQRSFEHVIYLGEFNRNLRTLGDGCFYVGASVRLQKLINEINQNGYGGIEYLFSVPGTVGGAVLMNAGRGKKYCQSIGDYVKSVDVFYEGTVKQIMKEECCFAYRSSIFSSGKYLILGATFHFPPVSSDVSSARKRERLEHCKIYQDNSKPNLGTLLKQSNRMALRILKLFHTGYSDGIHFSSKTSNWLVNEGAGTFEQAEIVIQKSAILHKVFGCKQQLEIVVWK